MTQDPVTDRGRTIAPVSDSETPKRPAKAKAEPPTDRPVEGSAAEAAVEAHAEYLRQHAARNPTRQEA